MTAMEFVLDYMALSPQEVFRIICEEFFDNKCKKYRVRYLDRLYTLADIEKIIEESGRPFFDLEYDKGEVSYMPIGKYRINLLIVKGLVLDTVYGQYCRVIFSLSEELRSVRIYDYDYDYWQNAYDPIQYTTAKKDYSHLTMRNSEAPPPLDRLIIDTSNNPGRRILREGFVEAVGSIMWLGKGFWSITGACKRKVLTADWLQCEHLPNDVLRIQAADEPFKTAEGEQGEIQDRLRKLLFPNTAVSRP